VTDLPDRNRHPARRAPAWGAPDRAGRVRLGGLAPAL